MQQLKLGDPQQPVDQIVNFLKKTFQDNHKSRAVIAVSGGIDSALSLTLLTRALSPKQIYPIFLPYKGQSMDDAKLICQFNKIPEDNWQELTIFPMVKSFTDAINQGKMDKMRTGNIMARSRMILIYDRAKKLDALVVGTENKTEKYLGYFTRFGDEASDVEPIVHLYKAQVRELARHLKLPGVFVKKAPSAGLWEGQTDEEELGFSYADADKVIYYLIEEKKLKSEIIELCPDIYPPVVEKIVSRVETMSFKQQVPYHL